MEEEFDTDQLVEFCQRLGLASDGYMDEKELAIVCNCIGLQAPEDMLQELFEALDTDKDGKVCLNELSEMLRGMPKTSPQSPQKLRNSSTLTNGSDSSSSPDSAAASNSISSPFRPNYAAPEDRSSTLCVLDPHKSGFTKVGNVLDMWLQWGVGADDGARILKEMGFSPSRGHSINLQDLSKAIEDEVDGCKEDLPIVVQTALLTYKTETQYLKSICDSMECERDKLRSDILEAHQRSTFLAQEVDEQNTRMEKNSQIFLQKVEAKYVEQIHELQIKLSTEKEALQNALYIAEAKLTELESDESKLKASFTKLNDENCNLEREVKSLNEEVRNLNKTKDHLEKEISRYIDLENKVIESERRNSELAAIYDAKLDQAHSEIQHLRDQNDELTSQVETMREKMKTLKAFQEKRSSAKRRKGSSGGVGYLHSSFETMTSDTGRDSDSPLEKIGKFHLQCENDGDISMFSDGGEDLENSLASCGSSHPESGNYPASSSRAINLAACMGESSTDSSPFQYNTLEREMESVKQQVESIIVENRCLKYELDSQDKMSSGVSSDVETQTVQNAPSYDINELLKRIQLLESEAAQFEKEKLALKQQSSELESSIELLKEEFEKCEDYWQEKLRDARQLYEEDKQAMDDRFQQLLEKVKEYEEAFVSSTSYSTKLSPIEERASLEQQVTELEEECQGLKKELFSVKLEHESIISNYQRQFESRTLEECNHLEQQVAVLTKKCQEYENRLSSLAEEERSTVEDNGDMADLLKDRIRHLEFQLKSQEHQLQEKTRQLENQNQSKDGNSARNMQVSYSLDTPKPSPPQSNCSNASSISPYWNNQVDLKEKSRSLLELLHQHPHTNLSGEKVEEKCKISPTWLAHPTTVPDAIAFDMDIKSASLPFIPLSEKPLFQRKTGWLSSSPFDPWGAITPQPNKKAWCHVELGWLQALRSKLRQREEFCLALQSALRLKDRETEKASIEHKTEMLKFKSFYEAQLLQQNLKKKAQEELIQDLYVENSRLITALQEREQKITELQSLLKFHAPECNLQNQNSTQAHSTRSLPFQAGRYPNFSA